MLYYEGKEPNEIHYHGKDIISVYMAMKEVWTLFLSCFGRGYWINDLPWVDTDVWKNE